MSRTNPWETHNCSVSVPFKERDAHMEFKGELSDEVRVGESYGSVFEIPDSCDSFPTGDTLNGKITSMELGGREFVSRSELTNLKFIPKPEAKGRIKIEFNESAVGFLF